MPDLNDLFGFRPDRPTHPDFTELSKIVLQHDGKTEDNDFDFGAYVGQVIDERSLVYMARQRALRVAPGASLETHMAFAALFLDAFLIGVRWQEHRQSS